MEGTTAKILSTGVKNKAISTVKLIANHWIYLIMKECSQIERENMR